MGSLKRLHVSYYTCGSCGNVFTEPAIVGADGEFLLRSETSEVVAYVNTWTDETFDEIEGILDGFPDYAGLTTDEKADLVQGLFGVSCDPAPGGGGYSIDRQPRCPRCGSRNTSLTGVTDDPPEHADVELADVTHQHWDTLTLTAKRAAVRQGWQERQAS